MIQPDIRYLYYALGGGLGHLNRTLALVRKLSTASGNHLVLTNCPHYRQLSESICQMVCHENNVRIVDLSDFGEAEEISELIEVTVLDFDPDVFVVDSFPRGLGGELVGLMPLLFDCKKVLISRGLPERYVNEYSLNQFVKEHYQLVIAPGETSPFSSHEFHVQTQPFLLMDANELPSPSEAAQLLSVDANEKLALVVASGNDLEMEFAVRLVEAIADKIEGTKILVATPSREPFVTRIPIEQLRVAQLWPLMLVLPAVDLVIGWGGYNLYWETQSLGIPALLAAGERKYDDQTLRSNCDLLLPQTVLDFISNLAIEDPAHDGCQAASFQNGAIEAASLIRKL